MLLSVKALTLFTVCVQKMYIKGAICLFLVCDWPGVLGDARSLRWGRIIQTDKFPSGS